MFSRTGWLVLAAASALTLFGGPHASAQSLKADRVYPAFGIGPTGIHATIEKEFVVTVSAVTPGSPAAEADLRPGDVLRSVEGRLLAPPDPRVALGQAIADAEAADGRLVLEVDRDGTTRVVTVRLPKLGPYGDTWPAQCAKSDSIIQQTVEYLIAVQDEEGAYHLDERRPARNDIPGCLATLFLLSVDAAELRPAIERHVLPLAALAEERRNAGGHVNWQLGYQGILLAEYFLKTGDRRVLAGLQEICRWAEENEAAGGWGHGAKIGPGYVQSGLMNHAGLPILIALILAQECGLQVDQDCLTRAVKLMYRMAGHGCIAYGDHRAELGWSNTNGRNAMLACAFSLLDAPEYQRASEHLGLLVADSYHQPEFGHTGGGFNVMWRGLGSMHAPESKQAHYRRQMDTLAWYYDLCRQFGGGFSMPATPPDNMRYMGLGWGTGAVGLTYTAPRRTLRITGAPPTKFSKKLRPVDVKWGTREDLAFFGTDNAEGFGETEDPPHVVYDNLLGKDRQPTVGYCAKYLRHYSPMVRTWAARCLDDRDDAAAHDALAEAVTHEDPRVRRAVFDAISGYDNWRRPPRGRMAAKIVSERFLAAILATLKRKDSAWWEIDGALFALGRAEPEDIRENLALVRKFGRHEDWYLREAATWALTGLHATMISAEFDLLGDQFGRTQHVFERSSLDGAFKVVVKNDKISSRDVKLDRAVERLGSMLHEPDVVVGYGTAGVHEAAHRVMMVLEHFDPAVHGMIVDDIVTYLSMWEPYYQHSVWLITGSKWQRGVLKVVEELGPKARPIVNELKRLLDRMDTFDRKRISNEGREIEAAVSAAVTAFEEEFGARVP